MVQEQKPAAEMITEWELLRRAQEGNEKAWKAIFESHSPRLLRLAVMMTGSSDAARDCVQEAFVRLLQAAITHHDGSVQTYLSTIVYRLAVKESTRRGRVAGALSTDSQSPDPTPFDLTVNHDQEMEIIRAIHALAQPHRDILTLRFYGGQSYEEISALTGVPVGTVKSRIFYAVKTVRTTLEKRGII
jgi:RNA polymerase sigma-70 factor (ECF subfamily)